MSLIRTFQLAQSDLSDIFSHYTTTTTALLCLLVNYAITTWKITGVLVTELLRE